MSTSGLWEWASWAIFAGCVWRMCLWSLPMSVPELVWEANWKVRSNLAVQARLAGSVLWLCSAALWWGRNLAAVHTQKSGLFVMLSIPKLHWWDYCSFLWIASSALGCSWDHRFRESVLEAWQHEGVCESLDLQPVWDQLWMLGLTLNIRSPVWGQAQMLPAGEYILGWSFFQTESNDWVIKSLCNQTT